MPRMAPINRDCDILLSDDRHEAPLKAPDVGRLRAPYRIGTRVFPNGRAVGCCRSMVPEVVLLLLMA